MQSATCILAKQAEWNATALLRSIWLTLTLGAAAVVISLLPSVVELLQFDRPAIASGEVWRLVTGNFVHWNTDHLLWDTLMFVVLGAAIEHRHRGVFAIVTALSALAVSTTVWFATPLTAYRGLSGIDSAQFVLLATWYLIDSLKSRNQLPAGIPIVLLAGFIGKIGFEIITGQTYFVDSMSAAFLPLPQVHLAGAAVGIVVLTAFFLFWRSSGHITLREGVPNTNLTISTHCKNTPRL
jgi:rhomboid family GlyGly-CTERM serine protease